MERTRPKTDVRISTGGRPWIKTKSVPRASFPLVPQGGRVAQDSKSFLPVSKLWVPCPRVFCEGGRDAADTMSCFVQRSTAEPGIDRQGDQNNIQMLSKYGAKAHVGVMRNPQPSCDI